MDPGAFFAQTRQLAAATGAEQDPRIVPLWRARPDLKPTRVFTPQSRAKAAEFAALGQGTDNLTGKRAPDWGAHMVDQDTAASSFLDMDPDEMNDFRQKATAIGLVDPDATTAQLFAAWQNMVSTAADYNATKKNPGKYISPWEAVDKLAMERAAQGNKGYDALSHPQSTTSSQVQTFTPDQVAATAAQVLQQELGRDPTDAELRAYTAAVNHAAKANPVVSTTTYDYTDEANPSQSTEQHGGVDAGQVILDQVRDTPEENLYQSATVYYQSALNALNRLVSL